MDEQQTEGKKWMVMLAIVAIVAVVSLVVFIVTMIPRTNASGGAYTSLPPLQTTKIAAVSESGAATTAGLRNCEVVTNRETLSVSPGTGYSGKSIYAECPSGKIPISYSFSSPVVGTFNQDVSTHVCSKQRTESGISKYINPDNQETSYGVYGRVWLEECTNNENPIYEVAGVCCTP